MKRLNFSLIIIFLITIMSVFGQERSLEQSIGETSYGKLSSADIYGDYFLFSSEKSVSLDLEGARLIDVLKMLSQQTGLNFISTEAVRGRSLTAYLKEVPLKQAMDILFKANNLTYEFYPEAKMFVVKEMGRPTIELKTKVYHLKYARALTSNMQKEIDKILKETKGIVEEEGGEDGGGQQQKKTGIKEIISQVLTDVGKVVVNDATNSLIVVDVPSQFPVIDELVSKLDVPPVKIMIEVEILDVDKDAVDKLGVKIDGTLRSGLAGLFTPFPSTFSPNKGPIPWRSATVDLTDIDIMAQLYSQDNTTKILARPRILTLNNETAEIDVITDEVIGTKSEYDDEGNIQSTEAQRVSDVGSYKGSGVTLRVTPQVNPETDEITLIVYPSVVDTAASTFVDEQGNTYRNIEDRSTRSVVRLDEGETLLLGGLIKNDDKEVITKVPFLGDIPLLGALFRHKDTTGTGDRELMVFITPRIMERNFVSKKKGSVDLLQREQSNFMRQQSIEVVLDRYTVRHRD